MTKFQYASKKLHVIAYIWLLFPIIYTLYAAFAMGLHGVGTLKLVLSPGFWFVTIMAFLAAVGIVRLHWYGWYGFLFSNFTIAYQTAVALAYYAEGTDNEPKLIAFIATLTLQAVAIYLVGREIRVPYFFPKIRWWESDPRYKLSVPAKIAKGSDQSVVEGEIMDLSLGGCFIKTHSFFLPDEEVKVHFTLFEKQVECAGQVVWRTESTVTHPKGIGVKFDVLTRENASLLKGATKRLKKLARVYNQMTRERNWQEYLEREQRYQGKHTASAGELEAPKFEAKPVLPDDKK